jgi:bacterioferritin (cytochrome b1)
MSDQQAELIRLLNEALSAEYGTLFLLPQHMAELDDEEMKRQLRLIAEVELEHAEKTAQMIRRLGGHPTGDLPQLKPRSGVQEILESHLAGEREAIAVYERAAALCHDPEMRKQLEELKRDEEGHQRLLERSLSRLK